MSIGSQIRRAAALLYGLWFVTVFFCCAVAAVVAVALLPDATRRRRFARAAARLVFRLTGGLPDIRGLERLPAGPSVVVANHASYLDGILLTAALPVQFRFVIKREMTGVPVVHFLLQRIDAHFVERGDKSRGAADMRSIMQTADAGGSLAFFPEGTFRREAGIRRFHKGAFAVAFRREVPLVPVAIRGTRKMLPDKQLLPRPARLQVDILEPFASGPHQSIEAARRYCRDRILRITGEPDLEAAAAGEPAPGRQLGSGAPDPHNCGPAGSGRNP